MSPATTAEFLTLALGSKVLDEAQFQKAFPNDGELPRDARECATVLVQANLLTTYQATQLIAGRHRGFILGPYRILRPIGQGGMGRVFLAEHMKLRRKVALKVMHGAKAENALSVERFFREARAAAALDHPNIVRIHDVCQQGQIRYLVMEYVEGSTLDALVQKGGAMGFSRAVDYIAQAAAGLQHAHEKLLIHRDIKPSNLILARDGVVKILDMGLARSIDNAADNLTQQMEEESVVGTADFISPEQSMNSPQIDIRGDIYSLGATFYTLVTGKPLFSGTTTQKLTQHQLKNPPSLTATDKTVPPGLAAVVDRMLQKKPEDRYQTPADVIAALAEWLPAAGTARVVAGLSGSDSSESERVKQTISDLVKGSSGNLRPAKRLPGWKKHRWAIAGGAVGLIAIVALCVALLSGSKKDSPKDSPPVAKGDPQPPVPAPDPPAKMADPVRPSIPTPLPKSLSEGLVGHWLFDSAVKTEAADKSGLGQTGTVDGSITWHNYGDRAGLVFAGNSGFVRVPDHRRLRFARTESFTLAVWLRASLGEVEGRWQGVVTKPHGRGEGWYGIWLGFINGQYHWVFGSPLYNNGPSNVTGSRATGGWQHVCIVQDAAANTRKIYVDGVDVSVGSWPAMDLDGLGDLVIGAAVITDPGGREQVEPFRGAIHEVRVYNRALSAEELLAAAKGKN